MKLTVRNTFALIFIAAQVLLIVGLSELNIFAAGHEVKRVFVLNSYHQGFPFSDNEMRGIDDAFGKSGIKVATYITYMDMKRIPTTPQYFSRLKELIREGYKGVLFDAIIACDNDALDFIRKYRDELFPGVPVVFTAINDFDERMLNGRRDITGTIENTDYASTISIALKLHPATKNIVVVTDNTTTGKAHRSAVEKIHPDFPQSLGFTYLSLGDMTLDELAQKLSKLNSDSIVLLLHHFVDISGTPYTIKESTSLLAKSSSVPVFVVNESRMGIGALGGHLVNGYSQGEAAAEIAVKILMGTDVKSIPVFIESPNIYMFDYSVMQRFSIAEKDLPKGSILINKPFSVLEKYRPQLFTILGVFIVLCGLAVFLLFEIRRRKRIENTLRESEAHLTEKNQLLSGVLEHTHIMAVFLDSRFNFIWVNRAYAATCGHDPSFFPGKNYFDLYPHEENQAIFKRVVDTGEPFFVVAKSFEFPDQPERGITYWDWSLIPVKDIAGKVTNLVFTLVEVTERIRAIENLIKNEERHRTILQTAMDGFWLVDMQGPLLEVNESYCRMSGYSEHELLAMRIPDLEVIETGDDTAAHIQKVIALGEDRFESRHRRKDGTIFDVEVSVQYRSTTDGGRLVSFLRDITKNKQAEESLRESEKRFRELAELLPETIYETDIQGILTFVNRNAFDRFGYTQEDLEGGLNALDMVAPNDRGLALESMQRIMNRENIGSNEYTMLRKDGSTFPAMVHSTVIINNGKLAGLRGFIVDITERKRAEAEKEKLQAQLGQAQKMEAIGQLAGGVAHDFNNINVKSEPGKGTTFKVYLPRIEEEEMAIDQPGAHAKPLTGTETVLLVEDEESLLKLGKVLLKELDYTVLTASAPGEAIRLVEEHTGDIHLLVTDVVMPEMSGRDLQKRLSALRPDMKYLFMSGYTANVIAHRGILDEGVNFIQKPFHMEELAAKVREAMGE